MREDPIILSDVVTISEHCQTINELIINVWVNFVFFDKKGNLKCVISH